MNFTMRNALLFAFIAACLGGVVAYVQYHKPHKDYAQATVEATWGPQNWSNGTGRMMLQNMWSGRTRWWPWSGR